MFVGRTKLQRTLDKWIGNCIKMMCWEDSQLWICNVYMQVYLQVCTQLCHVIVSSKVWLCKCVNKCVMSVISLCFCLCTKCRRCARQLRTILHLHLVLKNSYVNTYTIFLLSFIPMYVHASDEELGDEIELLLPHAFD